MASIVEIEGIGPAYAKKLGEAGINSTDQLLETGASPTGRKRLAEQTGIQEAMILHWVNMADLFRVKGVAEQYSDLLEAAGVDTVVELAQRNPEHLFEKIMAVNEDGKLVRHTPSESQIAEWVETAKTLPRMVTH